METIRKNTFETNSSSTHSLTITTEKLFEDFKRGDAILDMKTNKVYPLKDFVKNLMGRYPNGIEYKYWEYAEGAWEMYSQSIRDENYGYPMIITDSEDIDAFISYQPQDIQEWIENHRGQFDGMVHCFDDDARKYTTYDVCESALYPNDIEYSDTVEGVDVVVFGYWSNNN